MGGACDKPETTRVQQEVFLLNNLATASLYSHKKQPSESNPSMISQKLNQRSAFQDHKKIDERENKHYFEDYKENYLPNCEWQEIGGTRGPEVAVKRTRSLNALIAKESH